MGEIGGKLGTTHPIFPLFALSACGADVTVKESTTSGSVTLTWSVPTANADETALTDLAGYKVYYGTASESYTTPIDAGNVTTYTVTGLSTGTYYFAVTAYNSTGDESGFSNEASKIIQ